MAALVVTGGCQRAPAAHQLAIIDGTLSPDHPGVVYLHDPASPRSCSGTVIAPRVVVTAKHCLMDTLATDWIVAVGDVTGPEEERIAEYAVADMRLAGDPAVLVQGDGEDIAVVLLAEDFGYEIIPWAAVLPADFVLGSDVTLRAYGDTDPTDQIVIGTRMERSATAYDILPGTFAADVGGCNGDSGGPGLDAHGTVVGVASYADLPACGGWTRFERVDVQAALIQAAIDETGGVGDGDGDADTDADADADADVGSERDGGPAEPDPPATSGGCSCRLVR